MLVIELDDSLDVAFVVAGKTGQLQDGVDIHEAGMPGVMNNRYLLNLSRTINESRPQDILDN